MPHSRFINQKIQWVDTDRQLEQCCLQWEDCRLLSVDSEFMRSRTYFPIAGLFQINDGKNSYLIDPQAIKDFSSLQGIFENPQIVKVLHSCSEDLEVFYRELGCLPENLFDTQVAAAMAGYGFSVGFGKLCHAILDVELPKAETRSNWLQRPLTQAQEQYAAIDVEYLTAVAIRLMKDLQPLGRLSWVRQECEKLKANFNESQDVELSWQRNRAAWKLDDRELYCFKKLSEWRERKARRRDLPRNRVVKDQTLMNLAQVSPTNIDELCGVDGMSERLVRSEGENLLEIISEAGNAAVENLPQRLPRPLSSTGKELAKTLRARVHKRALELNLSPELLVRKKDYEDLVRSGLESGEYRLPENMRDWREPLVYDLFSGDDLESKVSAK